MYRIGIDIGSTFTKYCVMDDKRGILQMCSEPTPIRQKPFFEEKCAELERQFPQSDIVSCGYGKRNIKALKNVNELTALAAGTHYLMPEAELVLDVGGQDTKIIRQEKGKLKEFFVSNKCAAGSGMFLTNVSNLLGIEVESIDLTEAGRPETELSSVCAVFAQSEIVKLLADNTPAEQIIRAVIWQIMVKAKPLLGKAPDGKLLLSGGLTRIRGIGRYTSLALERNCAIPEKYGQYLSAIGCCMV